MSRSALPTTSSECPSPYAGAVSIQFTPRSRARRIVAIDSLSSCGPHPNCHSPPIAQAPRPMGVNWRVERPRERVGIVAIFLIEDAEFIGDGGLADIDCQQPGSGTAPGWHE